MRWVIPSRTALFSISRMSSSSLSTTSYDSTPPIAIHWFRKGLRLHDNPALLKSLTFASNSKCNSGLLYPVYILDGDCYQLRNASALRANFLLECLNDLDASLRELGSRLYVVKGDPTIVLPQLWEQWNVTYMTCESDESGEPYAVERDAKMTDLAMKHCVNFDSVPQETIFSLNSYVDKVGGVERMDKVPNTMGSFQKLFGAMNRNGIPKPMETPKSIPFSNPNHLEDSMLVPKSPTEIPWPRNTKKKDLTVIWNQTDCMKLTPLAHGGETEALQLLKTSVSTRPSWVASYEKPKTSCTTTNEGISTTGLSPYLSLGCISPRTVWHAIAEAIAKTPASTPKSKPPVSLHGQLLWREFNHLMAHTANRQNPGSWGQMEGNIYCRSVPWNDNEEYLHHWKEGKTGYPWIDACMTQLRTEGWIHHLGRHATACFLTRGDLWQSWEEGAAHFESQLLDADYALNGFNWLWLSCSGFFYQYFRCYSPISFQKKNDKNGNYIRKWLPQLSKLPEKYIYEPWKAPIAVQKAAGVRIGVDYPKPIVDHTKVSKENMEKMSFAYDLHKEKMKSGKSGKSVKGGKKKRQDYKSDSSTRKKKQAKLVF